MYFEEVLFILVHRKNPLSQSDYLIGFRNLSKCVFQKFEAAGVIQTQVSNIFADGDGWTTNFKPLYSYGALVEKEATLFG